MCVMKRKMRECWFDFDLFSLISIRHRASPPFTSVATVGLYSLTITHVKYAIFRMPRKHIRSLLVLSPVIYLTCVDLIHRDENTSSSQVVPPIVHSLYRDDGELLPTRVSLDTPTEFRCRTECNKQWLRPEGFSH